MVEALDIQVQGIVQGVGFRPFVYRMAKKYLINGWVLNAADGVRIRAEGESKLLDAFVIELSENAPAAAQVKEIELKEVPLEDFTSFEIRFSDEAKVEKTTLVSPELATCDDCVRELFNPNDRRYRYPFINCTNCGPRFTIIERLPYDRKDTSMRAFTMCDRCANEYHDPLDRRFHAQPNACFDCGPWVSLVLTQRAKRADAAAPSGTEACGSKPSSRTEVRFVGLSPQSPAPDGASLTLRTTGDSLDAAASSVIPQPSGAGKAPADLGSTSDPSLVASEVRWGRTRAESDAIFAQVVSMLRAGRIVAVKGLGGFHLACDANNAQAVADLRARKHREGKAFAVMMANADDVRRVCEVNDEERALLEGAQRPIVLLRKRKDVVLAPGLADGLSELGVMLPYTPVQHLLMYDFAEACKTQTDVSRETSQTVAHTSAAGCALPPMLVMTSGNIHDEPIVIDDKEAREKLADVADAILGNNRAILTRFDDSVVRVIKAGSAGHAIQVIRRARSYAPLPIKFSAESAGNGQDAARAKDAQHASGARSAQDAEGEGSARGADALFATGPEQKNTFALVRAAEEGAEAFVSQHIGDMENAETYDVWLETKRRFEDLFELRTADVACDLHPEYLTSKWAHAEAGVAGIPLTTVQHHHAHIAAVMGEHNLSDAVCGVAFDGTGYGVDGAIWGGEVLLANRTAFERFANFAYAPMPGGAAAIKHPLRMAYGVLWEYDLLDHPGAQRTLASLGAQAGICEAMIEQGINTSMTSSVGRLFDAASALLGICTEPTYEGEGACLLEAAIDGFAAGYAERAAQPPTLSVAQTNVSRETFQLGQSEGGADVASKAAAAPETAVASEAAGAVSEAQLDDALADVPYEIAVVKNTATYTSTAQDTSVLLLDAEPAFRGLLDDLAAGVPTAVIARRFHDAFVQAIVTTAELVRALYGVSTVALSGGVFMNRYLIEHTLDALEKAGFTAAISRDLPPNDGCISFGQAVIAWAQKNEKAKAE